VDPAQAQITVWSFAMTLLLFVGLSWLALRTVMVLAQVNRHTPEAQLGREFQSELKQRGLLADPPRTP
jgi:hypothetical protein